MARAAARSIVFAFVLVGAASGQSVPELTARLAAAATVDDAMVGDDGIESDTYRTYERWRDRASISELRDFVRHPSPVVRVYAVRALLEQETELDWPSVLQGFLRDTADVTTFSGCCLAKQKVGDVVFEDVRPRLTDDQVLDAAEALIDGHSPLHAREWALRNLRLRDRMLHIVRELARGGDGPAGIALARYRLSADVPVLTRLLQADAPFDDNAPFLAAGIHADPRLLAPLTALADAAKRRLERDNPSRLRFWLQAIAAQRSPQAGAFLADFLRSVRPASDFAERDLLATMAQAMEPCAGLAAFADARAELSRRQQQLPREPTPTRR